MMAFSREIALSYRIVHLVPDQGVHLVPFGKPCGQIILMLPDPADEGRGHSHVQCAVAPTCQEVYTGHVRRNDGVDASEVDLLAKGCLAYRLGLRLQEVVALKLRTPAVPVIPVKAGIHDTVGPASFQYTGLRRCDGKYSSYADSGN